MVWCATRCDVPAPRYVIGAGDLRNKLRSKRGAHTTKEPSHSSRVAQSVARWWSRLDPQTSSFPPYEREGSAIEGECYDRI